MDKSLDKVTKKKMIFIICIMVFFILIYVSWPNIYCMNKLDGNNVCTYGKKFTSEELIGKNNKYKNYEFQKAIVTSYGSTVRDKEKINNHELEWLGNRNLIIIDGRLYEYFE